MAGKKVRRQKKGNEPAIGESTKISISIKLDAFMNEDTETELKFPSCLSTHERAFIHSKAIKLGLKSKSRGVGSNRFLTVYKRSGSTLVQKDAKLVLDGAIRQSIIDLVYNCPITSREKEDLENFCDRERAQSAQREFGYLSGSPNIPNCQINPDVLVFKRNLPIYAYRDQIINTVNSNQAVVVVSETGSGKTTQIPQMILEQYQQEKKMCRIICTQPRRISAVTVAERVAYERDEKVGNSIGYQIRLESRSSPKTVLTYCTNGVLLRTLMGGSALASITHIIVDEVHERDKLADFLLISLKDALIKYKDLKVILMSATIDPTIFSRYFNNCPVITVPGRIFDVEKFYLEDILRMTGYFTPEMEKSKMISMLRKKKQSLPGSSQPQDSKSETEDLGVQSSLCQQMEDLVLDPEMQADVDEFLNSCFVEGSIDSFGQILYMYVSEGVPVNTQHSETGLTGLMTAAHHGLTETVEQILKMGGDPTIQDKAGNRALDYAKKNDHEKCAHFLENITMQEVKSENKETDLMEHDEILECYQSTIQEDLIDYDLLLVLVKHIHLTQPKGSILVFLPGYDDIMSLSNLIQSCKEMEQAKYQLFILHSNMQTIDQKKVFSTIPDTRKIIISTNIAETSITIDDVVYVIDSGKVKEMFFDSASGVCSLQVVFISKACATQRAGRAGRTRPGKAYMLCSKRRYESLMENSIPEILRVPLHELCLHSKLLAPSKTLIADFMSKALEPPSFSAIRNSVSLLKTIGALTAHEDLTEIGQHLLDLTIEPKLGKMLLYACILKCLDPILTIACCLSCKEPFQIGTSPESRKMGGQSRRNFAAESFSDHMALLRAFQGWQTAKANNTQRAFCSKNLINEATMKMIVGLRTQLMAQLRAIGLVKSRGSGDIKDCNLNSEKWHVIKAVLVCGLYPSIARVDRDDYALRSSKEVKLAFHPSSTLYMSGGRTGLTKSLKALPTDWLIFEEISRIGRFCFIRCNTAVTSITVALFGGPLRLGTTALRSHPDMSDDSFDSEEENNANKPDVSYLSIDDWMVFLADSNDALSIYFLRQKFAALMIRRMLHPTKTNSGTDERIIETVVNVLGSEERNSGLNQPVGIGQRPKPMLVENPRPESWRSKNNQYDYSQGKFDVKNFQQHSPNNNYSQPYKQQQGTSAFSANMSYLQTKNKYPQNYSSYPKQDMNSQNKSKENQPNSSRNVLLANIEKYSNASKENTSQHTMYFLVKSPNNKTVEESQATGKWNFVTGTEKRIVRASETGSRVIMFFSIGGSVNKFVGCAEFINTQCDDIPNTYYVNWISSHQLPHHVIRHLMNALDENRRVAATRDGHEINTSCGQALMTLIDQSSKKYPLTGRPIQKQSNQ